ncbi:MAG: DUF433 domain-containing protein [Candidatus Poribacteria bacterium]|nr:DUF433 domain-containing protein [Candidatus Poribacteria bacterium]
MDKRIKSHIEITPGTCGGKPRIAGHRIRVQDIVIDYEHWGRSPEEIVNQLPITLADVHAALVYYYDNQEEIRQDIREERAFYKEMKAKTPSLVQQKLRERNAKNDNIPS